MLSRFVSASDVGIRRLTASSVAVGHRVISWRLGSTTPHTRASIAGYEVSVDNNTWTAVPAAVQFLHVFQLQVAAVHTARVRAVPLAQCVDTAMYSVSELSWYEFAQAPGEVCGSLAENLLVVLSSRFLHHF